MSKHRVVKSNFWVDDYVEELTIEQRYFFLYLLTNPNTNILGIYQTTIKRMSFETGLEDIQINNCLHKFNKDDKVHFVGGYILLVNFQKHQNPSGTMKAGIQKLIQDLPKDVIDFILSKKSRIYDRLYRGYLIDYEYPYIDKDKDKDKDKDINPVKNFDLFLESVPESIKEKWTTEQIKSKSEDLKNYCESSGKKYKDYYASLRNFLKKDYPGGKIDNEFDFL